MCSNTFGKMKDLKFSRYCTICKTFSEGVITLGGAARYIIRQVTIKQQNVRVHNGI